jgi:hypothetical protein
MENKALVKKWTAVCETGVVIQVEAKTKEEALQKLEAFRPDPSTLKESR